MNYKRGPKSLLCPVLLLLFSQASAQADRRTYEVADAYEIYSEILPTRWPTTDAHANKLVIRSETVAGELISCMKPDGDWDLLLAPVIADFIEQNKTAWSLEKRFTLGTPYDLISPDEIKQFFAPGGGGYEGFHKRYPDAGAWTEVSAVGFSVDRKIAIVYTAHHCGMLCGEGELHVLEKKEGHWQPLNWKGQSCGWVS